MQANIHSGIDTGGLGSILDPSNNNKGDLPLPQQFDFPDVLESQYLEKNEK